MLRRGQRSQERQRRDGQRGLHAEDVERMLEAPEARVEPGIDDDHVRHGIILLRHHRP